MNQHRGPESLLVVVVWLLAIANGSARGQFWTGQSSVSDAWSEASNWSPNAPVSGANTEITFGASPRLNPFQDAADPFVLKSLSFLSIASDSYTLGGNRIEISAGGDIRQDSAADQQIDNLLLLADPSGNYALSGDGAGALILAGGVQASGGSLNKTGSGSVIVAADVTGLGSIHLGQGTLRLGGTELISPTTAIVSEPGSLLDLNGESQRFYHASLAGTTRVQGILRLGDDRIDVTSIAALSGSGEVYVNSRNNYFTAPSPGFTGHIFINWGTATVVDGALGRLGYVLVNFYAKLQLDNLHYSQSKPLVLAGVLETSGDSSYPGPISFVGDGYISAVNGTLHLGAINTGNFSSGMNFLNSNGTVIVDGPISGDGEVTYSNSAGRLVINADSSYTGDTAFGSGVVEVNAQLTNTHLIGVSAGATLRGNLSAPQASLVARGILQPGAGVGKFAVLNAALIEFVGDAGRLEAEIIDPDGSAGVGYDHLEVNGTLSMPGTFVIAPMSLASNGLAGPLAGFDNRKHYDWQIIWARYFNDSAWQFTLDPSGFTSFNDLGGGRLWVDVVYPNVMLRFTPAVPEPTFGAIVIALGIVGLARRRSMRQASLNKRATTARITPSPFTKSPT